MAKGGSATLLSLHPGAFPPALPTATFPYRVTGKVGEGAMGEVYRAEDEELRRPVAIKIMSAAFLAQLSPADAEIAKQRFLQEARAAAALTHAGVTTVYRVGTEAGLPYIAMEWLDGRPLDEMVAERGRLSVDQVVRLGVQVLAALSAAHEAGIVHRDIKPGNLMVTREGRIKVTDFGIARVQGSDLAQTRVGLVLGTPQYASPEQLAARAVDSRTDLYALGASLYEALTGRPPFDAESLYELIHRVQNTMPAPPSTLVTECPQALDAVLLKALAKHPDERFATAREMAHALQACVQPQGAPPVTPPSRAKSARTLREPTNVTRVVTQGGTSHALVTSLVRQWPKTPLGRQPTARLLERLLERPLHAPAFCGALDVAGACVLVCDGMIYAAFDPVTGRLGDDVIESMPTDVDGALHRLPDGLEPRLIGLLASLLLPPVVRTAGLGASFADLPHVADALTAEGFDGALRFQAGSRLGFALFSRGARVLDVFSEDWQHASDPRGWELWIEHIDATASVEECRMAFPAITYRTQLRDLPLDVVRPRPSDATSIRVDTLAEAKALELHPQGDAATRARRGGSTLHTLLDGDPAFSATRWVLTELRPQFEQYGRASRWKALVDPLDTVRTVRLHHTLGEGAQGATFDAVTYSDAGSALHVIDRVAVGNVQAVVDFIARVRDVKHRVPAASTIGGSVLVAPSFSDEALAAYLDALRSGGKTSLLSTLDAFTHKEGFLRLNARSGLHVLLVEGDGGVRRPLVPS